MSELSNLRLMAQYNQWMNETLYTAAEGISDDQLNAEQGAFFGSIIGTFNHLLVGDIIWLKRFATHPADFPSLSNLHHIDQPQGLDQVLYNDLNELRMERELLDQLIIDWCDELTAEQLEQPLHYSNTKGVEAVRPLGLLLLHLFNHQTHHRGQLTTLLSQQGIDVGITDLLMLIPEYELDGTG